jgi:hypothetical protein
MKTESQIKLTWMILSNYSKGRHMLAAVHYFNFQLGDLGLTQVGNPSIFKSDTSNATDVFGLAAIPRRNQVKVAAVGLM